MDVILRQTPDNGDICVEAGVVETDGGLVTSAYLSLFNGSDWWGDLLETDPNFQYPSRFEQLLSGLPATTGNLQRLADAAVRDLNYLVDVGAASDVTATATMPGVDRIMISGVISAIGEETDFQFVANWRFNSDPDR